jgi:signal transduction histidine kinase
MSSTVVARSTADPAAWAVETTMYRALAVLRLVVLINSVVLNVLKWEGLARPGLAAAALVAMTLWTGFATWAYDEPRRRRAPLLLADLAVALVMVLLTLAVQSQEQLQDITTLPSFWVMAVALGWGIHWNWVGGLVASGVISTVDLAIRHDISQTNVGNVFLLMIGGPLIGYCAMLLKEMATARDRAERSAAAAAERARLARVVHDGVLQVLSLIQRRGFELGGDAAGLGRLAGEQEVALRSFVQQGGSSPLGSSGDLAGTLSVLASRTVTVSIPGSTVLLPAGVVQEVAAVVRACLDNVRRHVGEDAPAWVLVEDLEGSVVVTVRDGGAGIPTGRLEEARAEGRLGVSASIRGRVEDLGGTASLVTAPGQGTEWELTFPKS